MDWQKLSQDTSAKDNGGIDRAVSASLTYGNEGSVRRWMEGKILKRASAGGAGWEEEVVLDEGGEKIGLNVVSCH